MPVFTICTISELFSLSILNLRPLLGFQGQQGAFKWSQGLSIRLALISVLSDPGYTFFLRSYVNQIFPHLFSLSEVS